MDFQNSNYRGTKFRGRGKGRGGRGGRGRGGYKGSRPNRNKKYYQGNPNQNYDVASCNTQVQNDDRLIDTAFESKRGWNKKHYKEYDHHRNARDVTDTQSTGSQIDSLKFPSYGESY